MDLIVYEDEHLLVANKPSGWNTHAPSPFANEGLYEWLKNREPRWRRLAIIHRLDKETSGLIVFGKTIEANQSLTQQFENRAVAKKYIFLTDRPSPRASFVAKSNLVRAGDKYVSQNSNPRAQPAETHFKFVSVDESKNYIWQAEPKTGRTHQIRVHASAHDIPVLGDVLYGGKSASRLCLHAAALAFKHPNTGEPLEFSGPPNFSEPTYARLRSAIIASAETDAYRLVHGAADGWPNLYIDRWGDFLLTSSEKPLTQAQTDFVKSFPVRGVYHKLLSRQPGAESAQIISGEAAPSGGFSVRENGLKFKIRFDEGYSVGLFLDQRENRRRLLTGRIAADFELPKTGEVLNLFSYTCAFSLCAAARDWKTTSVDLSKKYLDWGRANFLENKFDPKLDEFLYGDAFQWLARLAKKTKSYDMVFLDPPTFSRSKESGAFRAEKDYGRLVTAALPLIKPGGVLFASANAAAFPPEDFLAVVSGAIQRAGRRIASQHYVAQPPDFPIHPAEPAYLKTLWISLAK